MNVPRGTLLGILLISGMTSAQEKPRDRLRIGLEASDTVLRGLDTYTSHELFSSPCKCWHEVDPIAPNTGNYAALSAFQASAGFAVIYGSRWLEKKHHPRWAKALLVADMVSESIAVSNNFRNMTIYVPSKK